jgi:hypothetical protein
VGFLAFSDIHIAEGESMCMCLLVEFLLKHLVPFLYTKQKALAWLAVHSKNTYPETERFIKECREKTASKQQALKDTFPKLLVMSPYGRHLSAS